MYVCMNESYVLTVVLNAGTDPEQPMQLLTRSLAQQLARMSDLSVATPSKLQKLLRAVQAKNKIALTLIGDNTVCPEFLQKRLDTAHGEVTEDDVNSLRQYAESLPSAGVLEGSASEEDRLRWHEYQRFRRSVEQLRVTSKESICREHFPDKPEGAYDDIWDRLEMCKQNGERAFRRRIVLGPNDGFRTNVRETVR